MIHRKAWARTWPEFGRGEAAQMKIRDYPCNRGNSLCCIKPYLSGRKLRASPPARLPFLPPWRGKQDVFHPVQLRDQSREATRLKLTSICTAAHSAPLQHTQSYSSPYIPSTTSRWTTHKLFPFLHGTLPHPLSKPLTAASPLILQFIASTLTLRHITSNLHYLYYTRYYQMYTWSDMSRANV